MVCSRMSRSPTLRRVVAASHALDGVRHLAGTDAGSAELLVPGVDLIEEVALLRQAGLSPYQALQAATTNPAEAMRAVGEFGVVLMIGGSIPGETRTIVAYCACTNEMTAARAAVDLAAKGIAGAKALKGGWEEWVARGERIERN